MLAGAWSHVHRRAGPGDPTIRRCPLPLPAGRLEDKSSLVRREALRLLQCLLLHNPFGPSLPHAAFEASLKEHSAVLEALEAEQHPADDFAELDVQGRASERVPKTEPGELAGAAGGPGEAVTAEPQPAGAPDPVNASVVDATQWAGTVQELKALVASLELAACFARCLAETMPVLMQLLASATVSDVQARFSFGSGGEGKQGNGKRGGKVEGAWQKCLRICPPVSCCIRHRSGPFQACLALASSAHSKSPHFNSLPP